MIKEAEIGRCILKIGRDVKTVFISNEPVGVASFSNGEIKLDLDFELEEMLSEALSQSGSSYFSEENFNLERWNRSVECFLADPLDGSYNARHNFPMFCTSVAKLIEKRLVRGWIYDYASDELIDSGLIEPICVSGVGSSEIADRTFIDSKIREVRQQSGTFVFTGFPVGLNKNRDEIIDFLASLDSDTKIRMIGSAAKSILVVSALKNGVYFEPAVGIWDVAGACCIAAKRGKTVYLEHHHSGFPRVNCLVY